MPQAPLAGSTAEPMAMPLAVDRHSESVITAGAGVPCSAAGLTSIWSVSEASVALVGEEEEEPAPNQADQTVHQEQFSQVWWHCDGSSTACSAFMTVCVSVQV